MWHAWIIHFITDKFVKSVKQFNVNVELEITPEVYGARSRALKKVTLKWLTKNRNKIIVKQPAEQIHRYCTRDLIHFYNDLGNLVCFLFIYFL